MKTKHVRIDYGTGLVRLVGVAAGGFVAFILALVAVLVAGSSGWAPVFWWIAAAALGVAAVAALAAATGAVWLVMQLRRK